MPRVTTRPSVVTDIYRLAATLREADRAEVESLGFTAKDAIRRSYRNAMLRTTYLVDGEIAAMSGLCGALLDDIGAPYLLTAPIAATVPVSFLKCARTAVDRMLLHRSRLEGYVAARYTGACRLIEALGFTLEKPLPLGPSAEPFRHYWMIRTHGN